MNPQITAKFEELPKLLEEISRNLRQNQGMKSAEDSILNWVNGLAGLILDVGLEDFPEPCSENRIQVDGKTLHYKSTQKRRIRDRFGQVHTLRRRVYRERGEEPGSAVCIPKDDALGLCPKGEASPGLEFVVDSLAACEPYFPVSQWLKTLFQIDFGPTGVQKTAERSGQLIGGKVEDLVSPEWQTEPCDTMIVTADATGSPRIADAPITERGRPGLSNPTVSKMCTLIQVEKFLNPLPPRKTFDDDPPRPDRCVTVGSYADRGFDEVDRLLRNVTLRAGRNCARQIAFKGDGLASNWRLCDDYFPNAVQILDPYHALEHLATFARITHKLAPEQPLPAIFDSWKRTLLEGDILNLLENLRVRIKHARPSDRSRARSELDYFRSNAHRMEYDRYLEMGVPIGTGNIESAAKRVIAARFKKQGMRWRAQDNRAILHLRLHLINGSLGRMFDQRARHRWDITQAA